MFMCPAKRHRQLDVSRGRLAAIALSRPREALEQKPRADPAVSHPPADRRVDVLDDIRQLNDLADALSKAKRGHVRLPALLTNLHELFCPSMSQPRLLVFVIAYYAEATLKRVLERIPRSVFEEYDCEILVVDDASEDRTFEIGREYKRRTRKSAMTVLRNEYNQGYGGNQKVGYAYAIRKGFDFVAMVHGDGQYAPGGAAQLLAPLRDGQADAVFGSRMMSRFGALKGGMPLYKYVGNRILTTGAEPAAGHAPVRVSQRLPRLLGRRRCSRSLPSELERLPLRHRDHHPADQRRARIIELPIPTYYGDEICRVNGMRYAKDVMLATLQQRRAPLGLLYQRRFDARRASRTTRTTI